VAPRSRSLVAAYVRHVGGEAGQYRTALPFHMYPQWGFPILGRALDHVPFDLVTLVNAGSEVTVHERLQNDVPLVLRARLEQTDVSEQRVKFRLRLTTGTERAPLALEVRQTAVVLLRRPVGADRAQPTLARKPRPRVPAGVREVGRFRVGPRAGLDFALLTGDINPLHWLGPYARAMGHPRPILHGFALLARAVEVLHRRLFSGDVHRIKQLAVRFTRPLRLPADVGVFVDADGGLFVGMAPSGPAYLTGSFDTQPPARG
jgi:acyl dehydratase